jgi:hypothetical protein
LTLILSLFTEARNTPKIREASFQTDRMGIRALTIAAIP